MKSSLFHLLAAVTLCIVALIGYGVWYSTVSAESAAVADLQNNIVAKTEAVKRIAATRASLTDIAGDEALVQSYFVPEANIVSFINALESRGTAQKASVSVLSVSESGTKAQPALSFSITVKGTFDAVMRTVGSIEYAPYALSISSLSVAQDTKSGWHADLRLLVGSMPANVTATSSSPNVPGTSTP